jgi:glycosyltransferase involved in cell wall biosynthesis
MKILFISMRSIHAIRWIENLKDTDHELYWFDVLNNGELEINSNVNQITHWQTRKIPYIKGEYFLRKKLPILYSYLNSFFEVTVKEQLHKIIREVNPDVVHSFEMQSCSYPILETMNMFKEIKWIYSCWGNDLYYYQNFKKDNVKIRAVLFRVNYLQTDCLRDIEIAKTLGYIGKSLPVIPGGSGFDLQKLEKYKLPISERKIILVKGYQHKFGRALNVVKALQEIKEYLQDYEIVIFGAHKIIIDYVKSNNLQFKVLQREELKHSEVIQLMGKSLIYIGNSISDGMPNTLLEAIVMGAFPIQSNPGGVTEEIIENAINGLLIENPEALNEIATQILAAINSNEMLEHAMQINLEIAKNRLDYSLNKQKVIDLYSLTENSHANRFKP